MALTNAQKIRMANNMCRGAQEMQIGTKLGYITPVATPYYVDTTNGLDTNNGTSWATAFKTMAYGLAAVQTLGTVYFVGDVREELTGSNLKFDVSIIGCGSLHHPDVPATGYNPGASMWRPPASPTAVTPLLEVRGRGWKFINIAFDCPVDAAAVKLSRNALSDVSEYDASHATFENCRFLSGQNAINDAGGGNNITIIDCEFAGMSGAAIYGSSTAVANPRSWKVFNNMFPSNVSSLGNATHMDLSLNESMVAYNFFGTVLSTAKYIDLTGGNGNIVTSNILMGKYDTSDYVAGTGDCWAGNQTVSFDITDTTIVNTSGMSLLAPTTAS